LASLHYVTFIELLAVFLMEALSFDSDQFTNNSMKKVVSVFCTDKNRGGQDRAFQFWDGLVNYKTHYYLSSFRPLLRGNSTTSNGLILKMNRGYNGMSRELEKFAL
jgi:hypothetical protein